MIIIITIINLYIYNYIYIYYGHSSPRRNKMQTARNDRTNIVPRTLPLPPKTVNFDKVHSDPFSLFSLSTPCPKPCLGIGHHWPERCQHGGIRLSRCGCWSPRPLGPLGPPNAREGGAPHGHGHRHGQNPARRHGLENGPWEGAEPKKTETNSLESME